MTRVAINGFGRIGRLLFRSLFATEGIDIVAINDLGDLANLAYLLQYDTVYRRYAHRVTVDVAGHALLVDGVAVTVLQEKDPTKLPWGALAIDVVVECTGVFESFEAAAVHRAAGARHVVLSAPAKDADGVQGGATVLLGINDDRLAGSSLTSNASCTTNAAAPVIAVLHERIGVAKAVLSTVHAYTATQSVVDSPVRASNDYRRGRAAAQNIAPSTTGAAHAVARAIPDLTDKFDGLAYRIPVPTGSLADITFIARRPTTVAEVNEALRTAATDPRWAGIFTVTEEQLVSSDIIGEPYGSIADLSFTKVVDGDLVKVVAWYDNEAGYVATLAAHVRRAAAAHTPIT